MRLFFGFTSIIRGAVGPWYRQQWYGIAIGNGFLGVMVAEPMEEEVL